MKIWIATALLSASTAFAAPLTLTGKNPGGQVCHVTFTGVPSSPDEKDPAPYRLIKQTSTDVGGSKTTVVYYFQSLVASDFTKSDNRFVPQIYIHAITEDDSKGVFFTGTSVRDDYGANLWVEHVNAVEVGFTATGRPLHYLETVSRIVHFPTAAGWSGGAQTTEAQKSCAF